MSLFNPQFANPAGSPIRELFPYLSKPGMISFAGGYPSPSLFDAEGIEEASARALKDRAGSLQYGPTEGSVALRNSLSRLMDARGIRAGVADILVTTGSQQGFDLLLRVLLQPGEAVWVETPAYPAALQALRLAGADIGGVPVDAEGLDVEQLARMLTRPGAKKPKFIYTVPTFSNPSGVLMSQERREKLVALAVEHGFLIVEDDPYGELRFEELQIETLYAIGATSYGERNPVLYLSSLSKTVSPGLRIGWLVAPGDVLRRCVIAKQTVDLCSSALTQAVASQYLDADRYADTVALASVEYRKRKQALVNKLREELNHALHFVEPKGGMFLWVDIRISFHKKEFFQSCVDHGVLYVPGAAFFPDSSPVDSMRLSFAGPDVAQIQEGVTRLAKALRLSAF